MTQAEFEKWLTAEEAAARLLEVGIEISPKTLGDRARAKRLPSGKPNGRRRYRLSQLLEHFDSTPPAVP